MSALRFQGRLLFLPPLPLRERVGVRVFFQPLRLHGNCATVTAGKAGRSGRRTDEATECAPCPSEEKDNGCSRAWACGPSSSTRRRWPGVSFNARSRAVRSRSSSPATIASARAAPRLLTTMTMPAGRRRSATRARPAPASIRRFAWRWQPRPGRAPYCDPASWREHACRSFPTGTPPPRPTDFSFLRPVPRRRTK